MGEGGVGVDRKGLASLFKLLSHTDIYECIGYIGQQHVVRIPVLMLATTLPAVLSSLLYAFFNYCSRICRFHAYFEINI